MSLGDDINEIAAKIAQTHDPERDHGEADDALVECIRYLAVKIDNTEPIMDAAVPATEALIARFEALPMWYA